MVSIRRSAVIPLSLLWLAQQGWVAAQEQQQPQPAESTQQAPAKTEAAKPASKKNVPADPSDEGLSIGLQYWYAPTHPHIRTGRAATIGAAPATLDVPGKNQAAPGVILSVPAGKYNSLRFSYFQTRSNWASVTTTPAVLLFSSNYNAGDDLSVSYKMRHFKASWDYMSWPFPIENSTFRVKLLFQMQYTSVHTYINGPITYDSSGVASQTTSDGVKSLLMPMLGVGLEKFFNKSLRWELQASGMALPHRSASYDADMFFAYKRGHLEFDVGAKTLYIRTSPQKVEYIYFNMPGAYAGVRWYL